MLCIAFCVVVSAFQGSKLCAVSPMNAARLARTENQNLIWICCVRCCDRVCSTLTLQIFNGWPFHFFAWSYFCTFVGLFFVFSVCLSWLNKFSDGALVETVTECTCTCVHKCQRWLFWCVKRHLCCTNAKLLIRAHINVPVFCCHTVLQVWHLPISWQTPHVSWCLSPAWSHCFRQL